MKNNDEIVFDEKSGISMEDQQEILSKINGITETQRLSLAQNSVAKTGGRPPFKAKKRGGSFPLAVNAAALALLAAGILALFSFQGGRDADIRESSVLFDSAERALIDEIRRETALLLAAQDMEIMRVSLRLQEIEAELYRFQQGGMELTGEQAVAQSWLFLELQQYSFAHVSLQNERAQILEDSRVAQARLRGEDADDNMATLAALELSGLAGDLQTEQAVEAHMNGGIAFARDLIQEGRFAEAGEAVNNLRLFINSPAFQGLRSLAARQELYNLTFASLDELIAAGVAAAGAGAGGVPSFDLPAGGATDGVLEDLQVRNAQLEEAIIEMNRTITALSTDGAGQAQHLMELESSLSEVRSQNMVLQTNMAALQSSITEREQSIAALETDRASLNSALAARESTINDQAAEIASLSTQLTQIRDAMQTILNTN
ncbi:MAG: hypothetical protein FWG66_09740 [Spirochaetes bacterium]|nr:hypothetical protein [Spirochaetota bacterium]